MRPTRVRLRGRRNRLRRAPSVGVLPTTACHAPAVQMFLGPDGSVRPCCRQLTNYGNEAETSLLDKVFRGEAKTTDAVSAHVGPMLPLIGIHDSVAEARDALAGADALLVTRDGKPHTVVTRQDLLAYLSR